MSDESYWMERHTLATGRAKQAERDRDRAEATIQRIKSYVALLESELDDDQGDDDFTAGCFAAQRKIVRDLQERLKP